jgi:hypothetical protein
MKKIGFLSFGHWTPSSQSQTRSAADTLLQSIDLAVAAEEFSILLRTIVCLFVNWVKPPPEARSNVNIPRLPKKSFHMLVARGRRRLANAFDMSRNR